MANTKITNPELFNLGASTSATQLPVMTTTQRTAMTGLSDGEMIFNSTTDKVEYWDGTKWYGITYEAPLVPSNSTLFLDPSNINSYPGTGTTWTDLSTNGNNATLTNMTFTGTAGTNGYFTITNRGSSYARLPANIPSLGWGNNQTTDLSFSIWYYPTAASLFSYVFNKSFPPYEYALIDEPTANRLFFLLQNSSGGNVSITQITLPARNQWHNIIITLQATSTGVKIYNNNTNGNAVPGSGSGIRSYAMSTTNQLSIPTSPYASVNDRIAKFSCYNTVLTQTEMADIFNAGSGA